MGNKIWSSTTIALCILSATIAPASALEIVLNFVAPGETFPVLGFIATSRPAAAVGTGNIQDVAAAAAGQWERRFDDPHQVRINFGWSTFGFADGVTNVIGQDPATGRVTEANIRFNDSLDWFLDPTPSASEEYQQPLIANAADLGGRPINTFRAYGPAIVEPPAIPTIPFGAHRDLLGNAVHEIGHALNVNTGTLLSADIGSDGDVDIRRGPFAGTEIPWTSAGGGHPVLDWPIGDLVMDGVFHNPPGVQRGELTDADIVVTAEVSNFKRVNVDDLVNIAGKDAGPGTYVALPEFSDTSILTLNGDAAQADSVLRLTPDSPSQAGSAFLTNPFRVDQSTLFETRFDFLISGGDGSDGLAFVIHSDEDGASAVGGPGGNLGYGGISRSLAIEFDTHLNVFASEISDPNDNHVAVSVFGRPGFQVATGIPSFDLNAGDIISALINYDGAALDVFLSDEDLFSDTPILSTPLSLETVIGRGDAFFGFTAGTGDGFNAHDILNWDLAVSRRVPEPTSLALFGLGLAGLGLMTRRRRKAI